MHYGCLQLEQPYFKHYLLAIKCLVAWTSDRYNYVQAVDCFCLKCCGCWPNEITTLSCVLSVYVAEGRLSCQLYQRSADILFGVGFNIAFYALPTMVVAQVCNLKLGDFEHTIDDAHVCSNHMDQVRQQLNRDIRILPQMKINLVMNYIFGFRF